ncbi:MAG: thioredoxin family protein [Rhodocyclaceae bacterium]|nr:thioredoxin family protein [Rhodocyclaceae bacterium]
MLKRLYLLCLCVLSFSLHAQEPMEPEQAFRFSAQAVDAQTVELRWDIAPGYYMYRDKFSFAVEPGTLGKVELPPGHIKDDENFGRVETYRDVLRVQLPVSGASGPITLRATSQGCADMGVCYPPQKQAVTLTLPAAGTAAAAASATPAASPPGAAPTWKTRLLRPEVFGPALLGLIGVAIAAVPLRVKRGLWFKGIGFLLMFVGAVLLLMLNHDESEAPPAAAQNGSLFTPVRNATELDAMLALAQNDKRPTLLDFYADWCGPCREMDAKTFTDAAVRQKLAGYALLRADVTGNTPEQLALLKRFGLQGPPGIIRFDANGGELADKRIIGFRAPEAFLAALNP